MIRMICGPNNISFSGQRIVGYCPAVGSAAFRVVDRVEVICVKALSDEVGRSTNFCALAIILSSSALSDKLGFKLYT